MDEVEHRRVAAPVAVHQRGLRGAGFHHRAPQGPLGQVDRMVQVVAKRAAGVRCLPPGAVWRAPVVPPQLLEPHHHRPADAA